MIDDENQTAFAQDEPVIEADQPVAAPVLNADGTPVAPIAKKRMSPLMFALMLLGVMFVLLIVVALVAKQMPRQTAVRPSPTTTTSAQLQTQSELDTTLNLLQDDVTKADPSINDLPIPPIDFKLSINAKN